MQYLTNDDLKPFIKDVRLSQLLENDSSIIDHAESIAIAEVKDALYSRYDLATIFNVANTNNYPQVKRWLATLILYFLYRRLPDQVVSPSVIRDYDEVREILKDISDAKVSINLPHLPSKEDPTKPAHKFRWGSKPTRSN